MSQSRRSHARFLVSAILYSALALILVGGAIMPELLSAHQVADPANVQHPAISVSSPLGSANAPIANDAFGRLDPCSLSVAIGTKFTIDIRINSGTNIVVGQQSYLTFNNSLLQVVDPNQSGCVAMSTVQPDTSSFEVPLQNTVNNATGEIAYASGTFGAGVPPGTDFRVARVTFCAIATGTATLHWQFQAPNRISKITDPSSNSVQNPALYIDCTFTTGVVSTATPIATSTAVPTNTPTSTPIPTATSSATQTSTPVRTSTQTNTVIPTSTRTTALPTATSTNTIVPTTTATNTIVPTNTRTNTAIPTNTQTSTVAPISTQTGTLIPTSTGTLTPIATATATSTIVPTNTRTSTPTATNAATVTIAATDTPIVPAPTHTVVPATVTQTVVSVVSATNTSTSTSTPPATTTPCLVTFTDVPLYNTFYQYIRCLACRGIISGYSDGTFRPGNGITRGQIAKMVSNAAGFNEDPGAQIYKDVDSFNTFYIWINRLSRRGYMGGYPCGAVPGEPCIGPGNLPYFRPFANATRGQLAKIVSNTAGIGGTPTGLFYTDVPEDNPFYVWIMRLTNLGVMSGYPCGGEREPCDDQQRPYFRPFENVTRGQASKIVANAFFPGCGPPFGQ